MGVRARTKEDRGGQAPPTNSMHCTRKLAPYLFLLGDHSGSDGGERVIQVELHMTE